MNLFVLARHELLDQAPGSAASALLLEGSWPAGTSPGTHDSLDEAIDARFTWIDQQAARWAERLAEPAPLPGGDPSCFRSITPGSLNALALRYYLVKPLRVVAYFTEVRPLRAGDTVQLVAARDRDEDYAHCLEQLCRRTAAECRVRWVDCPPRPAPGFPPNGRPRRWAGRLAGLFEPQRRSSDAARRVVLCGNPRLLDPVCRELLARNCSVWWLYDRFALRSWLRWRAAGVGQLVCDSSLGRANRLVQPAVGTLDCRGVDLARPVARWIAGRLETHGRRQTRIVEAIDEHFDRLRPNALVLDEDATPLARAAVALARRHRAASFVVQHGAPCCRFGFAPPAADRIFAWGRSSQDQLTRWGVSSERIRITGSPQHDVLRRALRSRHRSLPAAENRPPRILLLATSPPRDDRPDSVALHLTGRHYAGMLRMALEAVSAIPGAELIVKLHPRTPHDPIARAALAEFPSLASRVVTGGPLATWLARTDCVLSCASSAGVESTLAGLPVIQLLPAGSGDVLPHDEWGMIGTARYRAELDPLLARALSGDWEPATGPHANVFGPCDGPAAARIAQAVLAQYTPIGRRAKPVLATLSKAT